jgi:hypothetical protein
MNKLTGDEFRRLTSNAVVLKSNQYGVKVVQTPDGKIIKLYRLKKRFSSGLIYPMAIRFVKNSVLLKKLGIKTITVEEVYDVPEIQRQIVIYQKLTGSVLREALSDASIDLRSELLEHFAYFISSLHDKGVLFRSIHFGNVLILSNGDFALIDIADMRYHRFGSLLPWQRLRNFRHMLRYSQDMQFLEEFGVDRFINLYLKKSASGILTKLVSKKLILRYLENKAN